MAATTGVQYGVGLRHARLYALDANGVPAATAATYYEGLEIAAPKAWEMTIPDARRISHVGSDRLMAQDFLPRIEPSSATLRMARADYSIVAAISGVTAYAVGEAAGVGYGTSKQGFEPNIGLLLYQQSLDVNKLRNYRAYVMPVCRAILNPGSMNENPNEFSVQALPQIVSKHLWGIAYASGVEGFTEAELEEYQAVDIPHVVSFKGDGATTNFLFHTSRQAVSTSKIHVITTMTALGVCTDVTGTATKATTGVTISPAPASGVIVTVFYEYAD